MPVSELHVVDIRMLEGCSAGLNERTAIVTVGFAGDGMLDTAAESRIWAGATTVWQAEPFYRITESDWPTAFLVDDSGGGSAHRLGEWIVAVTVAIQRWVRFPVWCGRVLATEPNRLRLAIPWYNTAALPDALDFALRLVGQWAQPDADEAALRATLDRLRDAIPKTYGRGLTPNMLRYIQAGLERGIPFAVMPNHVRLGWGSRSERMDGGRTGKTGLIAATIAQNKIVASRMLADAHLPVPAADVVADFQGALEVAEELGWPVVVKPLDRGQGVGVLAGIRDVDTLRRAFAAAAAITPGAVIVEKHVDGDDYRLLVVSGRLVAVAGRTPGGVVGDGVSTVAQLIDVVNADPRRVTDTRGQLKVLIVDDEALHCLAEQGLTTESVPAAGRRVPVRRTSNISTGGTAEDVTAETHPDNRHLAEWAARVVGLDITGVDLLITDITRSWREIGGAICEVNGNPGTRVHWLADPERDINGEVLDVLFGNSRLRIPTAAITGTNGKSTTAAMLHHIWLTAGACAGVCTTSSVMIGHDVAITDNMSGEPGGRVLLGDPAVEVAVIEMPRKGLLTFGHPCDRYDVAALLNVQDDHIGVDGIDTPAQMAELKAEVLERATGAVVVNAEDPLCMAMLSRSGTARHILVAVHPQSVAAHRDSGGEACFIAECEGRPWIVLAAGRDETALLPVHDIPATMGGLLRFNASNAMFAGALAWAQGVPIGDIRSALASFHNSVEQNPGRYNLIGGLPYQVLLDYAHNPVGVREVCSVASRLPISGRRIVCTLQVGNRHRHHLAESAGVLASTFDEFVIGCHPDEVSADYGEAAGDRVPVMLSTAAALLIDSGADPARVSTVADPATAIRAALGVARPGDLVVLLAAPEDAFPVLAALIPAVSR